MRTILMVLMIAGLMSTVGVYAAGLGGTPTTKSLGGASGTVSAPTATAVDVSWVLDAAGDVIRADVLWDPAVSANYTVTVTAGATTGSQTVTASGTTPITTLVTLAAADPSLISTADVVIQET